jgi:hypothetical protein
VIRVDFIELATPHVQRLVTLELLLFAELAGAQTAAASFVDDTPLLADGLGGWLLGTPGHEKNVRRQGFATKRHERNHVDGRTDPRRLASSGFSESVKTRLQTKKNRSRNFFVDGCFGLGMMRLPLSDTALLAPPSVVTLSPLGLAGLEF